MQERIPSRFGLLNMVRTPDPMDDSVTLYIHGIGGSWATWTPLIREAIAQGQPLQDSIFVDLPGFGRSENLLGNLDLAEVGEALLSMVMGLGSKHIRLVGHSMGGFLALDMLSRRHAQLLSGVVFGGAFISLLRAFQRPTTLLQNRPGTLLLFAELLSLSYSGSLGKRTLAVLHRTGQLPRLMNGLFAYPRLVPINLLGAIVASSGNSAFKLAARNAEAYDAAETFNRIDAPTHLYFGQYDRLVPPTDARFLTDLSKAVELGIVKGVGHFAHLERPDLVLAYIRKNAI
ncbi:MAG: alpha/beta fold hydrolase [Jatrophihabitantaceae bacterium]